MIRTWSDQSLIQITPTNKEHTNVTEPAVERLRRPGLLDGLMNWPHAVWRKPFVRFGLVAVVFCTASLLYYHQSKVPTLPTYLSKVRVFYNRVPKCGSRTVLQVFKILGPEVGFNMVSESRLKQNGRNFFVTKSGQQEFIDKFESFSTPLVYSRHVNYINFTEFNRTKPVYINVIRDPIERLISHYYFRMYGSQGSPKITNDTLTLDNCVKKIHSRCLITNANQVPFFCGHDPRCRVSGKYSLLRAKKSVEDNFLVVGVTENMKDFFEALSYSLPDFFKKAPEVYYNIEESARCFSKTVKKIRPKNETIDILRNMMKDEYEFYHFVRKRFYDKLTALRLRNGALKTSPKPPS